MKSYRWRFGSLYWRLTLSYFLVALVAVLVVTAYSAISPLLASASSVSSPFDRLSDKTTVPALTSILERSPIDGDALNAWTWGMLGGVGLPLGAVSLLEVLDARGQPVASYVPDGITAQSLLATPAAQSVTHAALGGAQQPAGLRRTLPDGQSVLAVPILADTTGTRVLGVFIAVCSSTNLPSTKALSLWLGPFLNQRPVNLQALNGWLWAEAHEYGGAATGIEMSTSALIVQVLDSSGTPICSAAAPGNSVSAILANPQVQSALDRSAKNAEQASAAISVGSLTEIVATMPLRRYDSQLLGTLVVVYDQASGTSTLDPRDVWTAFLRRLSAGFLFLVLATGVCTLAGAVVALGVRRRLRRITQAADAWSNGDLSIQVADRTRDEIGLVARQLNAMARQLQTLLATREAFAVVEERNRLARDLHDSVKQHVFAIALLVRSARTQIERGGGPAGPRLTEAEELATQTQQELTTLIRALRPVALADKGLVAVLRDYVSDWSRRTGIAAELRVQGERETPLETEEALLRVAQEALANIARHSGGTTVELRLAWERDSVYLTIEDNGTGFDVAHAAGAGVGLVSMRERIEACGGSLTLESAPGRTGVAACIPLPGQQSAEPKEPTHG